WENAVMSPRPVLLADLDGTITDSLPGIAASLHHALAAVGAAWDAARDIRETAGPPIPETIAARGPEGAGRAPAVGASRERCTQAGWLESSVFEGMGNLLARLSAEGYRMAVATSKDERSAGRILEHFELTGRFEFIGGADLSAGRSSKADVIAHSLTAL